MDRPLPWGGTSAPTHSRACVECARAKAKCISNHLRGKCSRCERLNKQCQPSLSTRKPRTAKRPPANSTARLEEKLDGLFSLLKSGSQPGVPPAADFRVLSSTGSDTQATALSDAWSDAQTATEISITGHQRVSGLVVGTGQTNGVPLASPENVVPDPRTGRVPDTAYNKDVLEDPPGSFFQPRRGVGISAASTAFHTPNDVNSGDPCPAPSEAKELLVFFETHMLGHLPFMKMPAYNSPHQFRAEHPFLFLCIMAVASRSTEQQTAIGKEVRLSVGRKLLLESERSLDLLFGIIVFTGWAQSHVHTNPIMTNFLQLAIGLLGDLGLRRSPAKYPPHLFLNMDCRDCPKPFDPAKRTNEERRVALGVFWLSSVMFTYFQRVDPMRWTPYLDECLQVLSESEDCSTDCLLSHLIRLQLLAEKAVAVSSHDDFGVSRSPIHPPTSFYLKTLLAQLEGIKQGIPLALQQNETLLLHVYSTELTVHEIALSATPSNSSTPSFERAEACFACLKTIRSWSDVFLQVPPATYVGYSMSIFTQLAHCIITLYRLSTFELPGWDQGLARETVDLSVMVGKVITQLRQVKEAARLDVGVLDNLDVYNVTAARLQIIKEWWDVKMAAEAVPVTLNDEGKEEMYTELLDDAWLKDILGMGMEDIQFDCCMSTV